MTGRAANSRILREINAKKDAFGSDAQGVAFFIGMGRERETARLMARNQLGRKFCIKTIDRLPGLQ